MVPVIDCTLSTTAVLRDAISVIEMAKRSIAVVLDENKRVAGTITDGDIRRALLAGQTLTSSVMSAANARPLIAPLHLSDADLLCLLESSNLEAVPLVDPQGRYSRVVHRNDLTQHPSSRQSCPFSAAVVMAGGEGRRLLPLTEARPKPMIEVGGIPLLERQLRRLAEFGVPRLYLSINYLGHIIESHFGDGAQFGLKIEYLREERKMGTAGALSLLPPSVNGDLLIINGDILTRCDFGRLGEFHSQHAAALTVAAVHHQVNIPYGVIDARGHHVTAIREKPSQQFLCNAGIYAASCDVLRLIPRHDRLDMTELVARALAAGQTVAVFPIYEFWSDIGTPQDLELANHHLGSLE